MTNDYAARKGGKRKRKPPPGTVDFISEAKLGGNKERPKRAKVRRLCRGHCFQEPVVKDEDKSWPQEEMVEGAQTRGSRRSELPIVVPVSSSCDHHLLDLIMCGSGGGRRMRICDG